MAVNTPAIAGNPEAREMPKHSGNAIKKTNKPDTKSYLMYFKNPAGLPMGVSRSSTSLLCEFSIAMLLTY